MKNLVVAQSGGPTAAINATLVGVVTYAKKRKEINKIFGAKYGIEGVLEEQFVDLGANMQKETELERLSLTPSSALGSCRRKITIDDEHTISCIITILRKYHVGYFIYIGGNDSMDTVNKLSAYCKKHKIEDLQIIGAPKTIDNDLVHIDHCPGFGSAAKYIATTFSELERDCAVYKTKAVTIVEVMGRNAGWLTASSALARINGANGPDLIYLCEKPFVLNRFISDIKEKLKEKNSVLIAVSEGIKDEEGNYLSAQKREQQVDGFGHSYLSGVASMLAEEVKRQIGCKVRGIELNVMQRCSGHLMSKTDMIESKTLGEKACECAIQGKNGVMVSLVRRKDSPYHVDYLDVPVEQVANYEKKVPKTWITEKGNDVTNEMMQYLFPLIQGECEVEYKNGIPTHMALF